MPRLSLDLVIRATGGGLVQAGASDFDGVSIDTRTLPPGALYVAIRGERVDGHDFVAQAAQVGAAGAIVARGHGAAAASAAPKLAILEVEDPLLALGRLAREHRATLPGLRVLALTGSVGKTSTKEMLASILAAAVGVAAVHKTRGNLNNHLGVPLTLLAAEAQHRYAVVEMGMSSLGEIAYLEGLARPDLALVTTVAGVHLEQLGGLANVGRAKGEIFEGRAAAGQAFAVAPFGERHLEAALAQVPRALRRTFGGAGADVVVEDARVDGAVTRLRLRLAAQQIDVALPILGVHHAHNAAAAAAAAQAMGIDASAIVAGLQAVRSEKHRMQLLDIGGRQVIDDCYNASPPSVKAALDALAALRSPRRVAILGDMLELGEGSPAAHAEIGRYAAERATTLVAMGPFSRQTADAARARLGAAVFHTDDPAEAAARALGASGPGDAVLVKASRGMKLERVIDQLGALVAQAGG